MARIPHTTNANGLWTPNDARDAELGEIWPATYVPEWADGYVTRITSLDGGNTFGNAYTNHWGYHNATQGYSGVMQMKCNYDWILQGISMGTHATTGTETLYMQWGVWLGGTNGNASNAVQWSGNNTYVVQGDASGTVTKSKMLGIGAGSSVSSPVYGDVRLDADTWYTFGGAFWQSGGRYYSAWNGGGYGNFRTSRSETMSGSGTGGVSMSPTFYWQHATRSNQQYEYFDNNMSYWPNFSWNEAGPMLAFKVKVFNN